MSKVLFIGGNGFIGSHLCDTFLAQGVEVRVLCRHDERFRKPLKGVEYISGDYGNAGILKKALDSCDTVIHLAHNTTPKTSMEDLQNEIFTNVVFFIKLLELMKEDPTKRLIYFSSGGVVYGNPAEIPVTEESPLAPISSYGVVKKTMESYVYLYNWIYGMPYLIIRPSNAYGEREDYLGEQGVIPIFIKKLLLGEKITIWGDGEIIRDYIYVKDLARAAFMLYRKKDLCGIFNASSAAGDSINDIIRIISSQIGIRDLNVEYQSPRRFDVSKIVLDNTKLKNAVGWEPETGLEHGIANTMAWLRGQLRK